MNNILSKEFWKKKAENKPSSNTIKVNPVNDYTQLDADFILQFASKNSKILDLASGTGLTINKYYNRVKHITAVELYKQFSDFIVKAENVEVINCDIMNFNAKDTFDIINT